MFLKRIRIFPSWRYIETTDVNRVRHSRQARSDTYSLYENYVKDLDRYILDRYGSNFSHRLQVHINFDSHELMVKTRICRNTRAPEEYVESALGLHGLSEEEVQTAPTFDYYRMYLHHFTGWID
ncbi:hypothetical protein PsorP6_006929 [Peronosclerospora sorghi]|uniref:Uncharacterized protein n=1 Tax=Peronosclerospora sorghi TaxID=230839 RepID=A0ACC0WD88_9STRA|nr:hypothetical protein PsorP6_006929 [Peronosclerospora sorghi]